MSLLLFVLLQTPQVHVRESVTHHWVCVRAARAGIPIPDLTANHFRIKGGHPFHLWSGANAETPDFPFAKVTWIILDLEFTTDPRDLAGFQQAIQDWSRQGVSPQTPLSILFLLNGSLNQLTPDVLVTSGQVTTALHGFLRKTTDTTHGGADDLLSAASLNVGSTEGRDRAAFKAKVRRFVRNLAQLASFLNARQGIHTVVFFSDGFTTDFLSDDQRRINQVHLENSGDLGYLDPEYMDMGQGLGFDLAKVAREFNRLNVPILTLKLAEGTDRRNGALHTLARDSGGISHTSPDPRSLSEAWHRFDRGTYLLGVTLPSSLKRFPKITLKGVKGKLSVHWLAAP